MQFYICRHCGTIVSMIHKGGCLPSCCGKEMQELKANTSEVHVAVGSVVHPMEADHYIQWIAIETEQGVQRKTLKPGEKPEASFALASGDKLIAAYEYCNKHGLWAAKA